MLDYHVILDLMPTVASLFFQRRLVRPSKSSSSEDKPADEGEGASGKSISLSAVQSAILLGMGLQRKTVEDMEVSFGLLFIL